MLFQKFHLYIYSALRYLNTTSRVLYLLDKFNEVFNTALPPINSINFRQEGHVALFFTVMIWIKCGSSDENHGRMFFLYDNLIMFLQYEYTIEASKLLRLILQIQVGKQLYINAWLHSTSMFSNWVFEWQSRWRHFLSLTNYSNCAEKWNCATHQI